VGGQQFGCHQFRRLSGRSQLQSANDLNDIGNIGSRKIVPVLTPGTSGGRQPMMRPGRLAGLPLVRVRLETNLPGADLLAENDNEFPDLADASARQPGCRPWMIAPSIRHDGIDYTGA
jgi:hypothetical protein